MGCQSQFSQIGNLTHRMRRQHNKWHKKVLYELPYLVLEVIFPNSMQSLSLFHYDTTAGLMTIQIIEYLP